MIKPSLMGWLGHKTPFDFSHTYVPGTGINRMKIGTPPVLAMLLLQRLLKFGTPSTWMIFVQNRLNFLKD